MRQKRPRPSAGRPKSEVSVLSLVPKCGVNSNHHSHRHPHLHFVHNDDDQVREDPVREAVRRPLSYIETSPSLPSPLLKVMIWSKMLIRLITIDNHYLMIWALIRLIMIDNYYDHMIRAWSGSRAVASSQGGEKGSLSSPRFCQHLRHLRHLCHFRQSHHCSLPLVTDLVTDPMTDPMNSPMTNHFCLQLHVFAIFAVIAIIITITIYSNSY